MASSPCTNQISIPLPQVLPEPAKSLTAEKHSYGQILKSSALIGGSSVVNIGIGIVRTKAMAMLLGPAGFGLAGLFGSISDLSLSVAGMGINSSGVRQIAEAAGSQDAERIARTAAVVRRTSIALGLIGAVLLVVFSRPISLFTLGSYRYTTAVRLLSLALFFRSVSAGQGALIQGMRRIADLAKMGVLGALFGTLFSIILVYFFREDGVVPSLVAVAAMTVLTSWWYSRKVRVEIPPMTASQVGQEAGALLKLGFVFMTSGLMVMGTAYIVRIILVHRVGFEATGLYQAAWTLGGLYVGFILQAMGADFYPRLTANHNDNITCNRLVNEQTRVGLLLAGPGVIATLTFAPLVLSLFYSAKFGAAVEVLRWICLGAILQVITWPMGYIIVAKGKQGLFYWCELAWTIVAVGLAWICVRSFGVNGAGIAFFGSYIFHAFLIYPVVYRLSGFRWTSENMQTGVLYLLLIGIVFCGFLVLPLLWAASVGTLAAVLSGIYSIRVLLKFISSDLIPPSMRRFLVEFRFASIPVE